MDEPHFRHLICNPLDGVLVMTISAPQVRTDELASELHADLLAALAYYTPKKVVFDLQHVQAMSSRGFGAIATFHQDFVRHQGGQVALCGLNPIVREMLTVIRFIDGASSRPVLDAGAENAPTGKPRVKPLFEIVAKNVPAAIERLNETPAVT
jgi:anti-anti-sigma factor